MVVQTENKIQNCHNTSQSSTWIQSLQSITAHIHVSLISDMVSAPVFVTDSKKWREAFFKYQLRDIINGIDSYFKTQKHNFCHMWHTVCHQSFFRLSYWAFHLVLSKLYTSPGCNICPRWHQTCFTLSGCSFEVFLTQETGEMNNIWSFTSSWEKR